MAARVMQCLALVAACLIAGSAGAAPGGDLTAGCAGGISGGRFGVTLRRSGEIFRWHTASRHEEPAEFPMGSRPVVAKELFAEFDTMGFEQIDYQKTGNMTCSLVSGLGESVHRVSWSIGDSDAPAKVADLARRIRELVDDAMDLE